MKHLDRVTTNYLPSVRLAIESKDIAIGGRSLGQEVEIPPRHLLLDHALSSVAQTIYKVAIYSLKLILPLHRCV